MAARHQHRFGTDPSAAGRKLRGLAGSTRGELRHFNHHAGRIALWHRTAGRGKKKADKEKAFRFLAEDYQGRFFDFDAASAVEWGRYAAELEAAHGADWWKHFDLRDTQIAAIAREYGLTVAMRNTKDFPFCATENPFRSPAQ